MTAYHYPTDSAFSLSMSSTTVGSCRQTCKSSSFMPNYLLRTQRLSKTLNWSVSERLGISKTPDHRPCRYFQSSLHLKTCKKSMASVDSKPTLSACCKATSQTLSIPPHFLTPNHHSTSARPRWPPQKPRSEPQSPLGPRPRTPAASHASVS